MEEYVFIKSRNFKDTFKSLYSHLCKDIAPAVLGVILLYVAYSEYYELSEPNVAIWYLIAGIIIILYALFRFWRLYIGFSAPHIKSFTLNEKEVRIEFNKYPYKAEAPWKNIELIEYFPGEVDPGLYSTVEYLDYTDFYGQFKDYRGAEFNQVVRIMNSDWKSEQEDSLFVILQKLEGSKDKLKVIGRD